MVKILPVRKTDPYTSYEAAAAAVDNRAIIRMHIRAALATGPMSHDMLIEVISKHRLVSPSGVRTRVSEMVRDGVVEAVPDRTTLSKSGRKALLWRLT